MHTIAVTILNQVSRFQAKLISFFCATACNSLQAHTHTHPYRAEVRERERSQPRTSLPVSEDRTVRACTLSHVFVSFWASTCFHLRSFKLWLSLALSAWILRFPSSISSVTLLSISLLLSLLALPPCGSRKSLRISSASDRYARDFFATGPARSWRRHFS